MKALSLGLRNMSESSASHRKFHGCSSVVFTGCLSGAALSTARKSSSLVYLRSLLYREVVVRDVIDTVGARQISARF